MPVVDVVPPVPHISQVDQFYSISPLAVPVIKSVGYIMNKVWNGNDGGIQYDPITDNLIQYLKITPIDQVACVDLYGIEEIWIVTKANVADD